MPQLSNSETYTVRGTMDVSSGTLTMKDGQFSRAKLVQEDLSALDIPLVDARVWDDQTSFLPGTAATDDLGIIEGTWGTDAPTIQTSDAAATTVTQRMFIAIPITNEYVEGETIQLRIRAGMVTTISDGTATVDLEAYVNDGDGAVGSDLCTTVAQSINTLAGANEDFTIDGSSLLHGDTLLCRITVAITDAATGTVVLGEIRRIQLLRDIKG